MMIVVYFFLPLDSRAKQIFLSFSTFFFARTTPLPPLVCRFFSPLASLSSSKQYMTIDTVHVTLNHHHRSITSITRVLQLSIPRNRLILWIAICQTFCQINCFQLVRQIIFHPFFSLLVVRVIFTILYVT